MAVGLRKFLQEQKWMFFIFVLWAITYIALNEGILTRTKTVTVTGNSMNAEQNKIATFSININSKNEDKLTAVDETNRKSGIIVDSLKNFGIEDKNLQVANMNIYQDQNYVNNEYVLGDWNVSVSIEIKLYDMKKVNDLTDLVSNLEVTNFYGPNYTTDTVNFDESALLESAMKDAKSKAENIAKNLNRTLGKVMYIAEDNASSYGPIYNARMSAIGMGGGGGADMMPGTTNVYKSVVITYELR